MNPKPSSAHYQDLEGWVTKHYLSRREKNSSKNQIHQKIQEYQIFQVNMYAHLH